MAAQQLPDNAFDPAEGSPRQRGGPDAPNWNHFNFPPDAPNTELPPFSPGFPPAPFPGAQTVAPLPSGSQGQAPGQPTTLDTETLTFGNPANTPPVLDPARPSRPSSIPGPSSTVTTPRPSSTFDPNDSDVYVCGSIPFVPAQYTCYANNVLCPVLNGKRLVPCGESCYDPTIYGCGDGGLEQIHSGRLPNGSPATNTVPLGVSAWPTGVPIPTPERSLRSSSSSSSSSTSSSTTSESSSSTLIRTSSSLLPTTSQPAATNGTMASAPADSSLSGNQIAAIAASTSSAVLICAVVVLLLFRRHASKRKLLSQKQVYPEVAFLYDPPVPPPIGTEGMGSSGENSSTSRRSYMVSQGQLPRSEPPSSDSSLRGVGIAEAGASISAAQAVERLKNERRAMRQKKPKLRPDPQPLKLAKGLAAGAAGGFGLLSSNGKGSSSATNLEAERSAGAPSRVPASSTSLWDEIDIAAGEANLMPSPGMPQHSETQKSTSPLLPPPDLSTPPQALHSPPDTSGSSPTAIERQSQGEIEDEPFYRRLQQRLSPTRNPTSFSQPRPFPYHVQRGSGSSLLNSPHSSLSPSPSTRSPLSTLDPTPISFPRSTATPFSAMTSVSPFTHQGGTGSTSTPSPWPPGTGGPSAPARTLPSPDVPFGLTTAGAAPGTSTTRGGPSSSPYPNPYPAYPYSRTGNYTFLQPELYHPPSPKPTPHNSSGSGELSGLSTLDTRLESGDTWAGEVLGAMGSSSIFGTYGAGSSDDAAGSPSTGGGGHGSFAAARSAQQQQQHGSASLPRYGSRLQVPSAGLEPPEDSGSPQSVQYVPHVHDPESSGDEGERDVGAGLQFGGGMGMGMGMGMGGGGMGLGSSGLGNIAEEMSGGSGNEGLLGGGAAGGQEAMGMGMGPGPTTTTTTEAGSASGKRRLTVRNEF
ncbi:uncharacterized protein J3D65DRAFT_293286 [Phyllosticta citribraziliensis]|uniref:Endo-1,3(4)-beta-glucanase 1 carbohydrate binding domain-containing protein n=1 Tax=Phyllosticta citribraziliensis TaxID=989973 RepID=A0ABR1LX05_9PEZI